MRNSFSRVPIFKTCLALIDAGVPSGDVSDDEDPILLVVVGNLVLADQLESVVLGEHLAAVRQDVPVAASNPRQLTKKKKRYRSFFMSSASTEHIETTFL